MYLLLIAFGLCVVYALLYLLFPVFFGNPIPRPNKRSLYALLYILAFSSFISGISLHVPDAEVSNRFLHAFGGGFLSFFICFLVVRDTGLRIGKFQFFVFSFLVVMTLGVANEIVEYILQHYTMLSFAKTANDTWLDLISNTAGATLAGACLTHFIKKPQ